MDIETLNVDSDLMAAVEGAESSTAQDTPDTVPTDPAALLLQAASEGTKNTDTDDGGEAGEAPEQTDDKPGDEGEAEGQEGEKPEEPGDKSDKGPIPYDRFKSVNEEKNRLRTESQELRERLARLEGQLEARKGSGEAPKEESAKPLFEGKTADDLRDAFDENPAEFLSDFAKQVQEQTLASVEQQTQTKAQQHAAEEREAQLTKTFQAFAESHEDYLDKWDSGELQKVMDANPGMCAIAAYNEVTREAHEADVEARIKAAREEGFKDGETKAYAAVKAKQGAAVLSDSPSGGSGTDTVPDKIKNPEKYGGVDKVLLSCLDDD